MNLDPCPHCGGEARLTCIHGLWQAECNNEDCEANRGHRDHRAAAFHWNQRAQVAA